MGNIFSRKASIKDRLLNLESEILKYEYELNTLKRTGPLSSIAITSSIAVPFIAYASYVSDMIPIQISILSAVAFVLLYFLLDFIRSRRIASKEKKLALMKQERRDLIEQCKSDVNFSMTKSLIERYEDEESRASFFNQIQKKKRSHLDSVTDFVLGNDPSTLNALICTKCGVHNGLLDPKNCDFKIFYCYNCKEKNTRRSPLSSPAMDSSSPASG